MPRIGDAGEMTNYQIAGSNFTFQGARLERLGATEYTLATVAIDETGSTSGFANELRNALIAAVEACKKSPRSDNLLLRALKFSTALGAAGVEELHGFLPLSDIDPNTRYQAFRPDGQTPLFDATYSAVGAMVEYGGDLMDNDYLVNGIAFIITDGGNNYGITTPAMIRDQIRRVKQEERLESLVTVLIGINAAQYYRELESFRSEAELDQYIDAGDVTPGKLARLAEFVSQSVSSQSQAIGSGGPSQQIQATI